MADPQRVGEIVLKLNDCSSTGHGRGLAQQKKLLSLPGRGFKTVILDFSGLSSIEPTVLGGILLLRQALSEEGCRLGIRGCAEPLLAELHHVGLGRLVSPWAPRGE